MTENLSEKAIKLLEAVKECELALHDYTNDLKAALEGETSEEDINQFQTDFGMLNWKIEDLIRLTSMFSGSQIQFVLKYKTNLFSGKDQ